MTDQTIPKGYDMSEHWRLVSVDGGPLTGTFWVTRATDRWPARVTSIDATLWDRTADYGFVYGPRDLSADVVNGQAELDVRTVPERRRALVEDYLDEVRAALAAAAAIAWPSAVDSDDE